MQSISRASRPVNKRMVDMCAKNVFPLVLLLSVFPVVFCTPAHGQQEQTKCVKLLSDKERAAIKRIALQKTAVYLRSVGQSDYPISIINDGEHPFMRQQVVRLYQQLDFSDAPDIVKTYFREMACICSYLLKNHPDASELSRLDAQLKKVRAELDAYLAQYNIHWGTVIFDDLGKTPQELMNTFVDRVYLKYRGEKKDVKDPKVQEKMIKEAYVAMADFFDSESTK